jgi:hypothetical protein
MVHKSRRHHPAPNNPNAPRAHQPAGRGNNPCDIDGLQKRHTEYANVAQTEATRDTQTYTSAPAYPNTIARAAEWKVVTKTKDALFECMRPTGLNLVTSMSFRAQ